MNVLLKNGADLFCVFRKIDINRVTERQREKMSERESDNTVSVIHSRPSVIFLNNEAGPEPLPHPHEASEAVQSNYERKVFKLSVCQSPP